MILLCIKVAFCWIFSNIFLSKIIFYLPLLIFAKFMKYFDKSLLSIWKILNLANLSKNPSFFRMFTIYKAVNFNLFKWNIFWGRIMITDKFIKVHIQFKGIKCVCVSQFKFIKSCIKRSLMIIFYDSIWVHFSKYVRSFWIYLHFFLKFLLKLFLTLI